ncbi:MAG: glycosyltransferase [Actinobacteria bacterium]|nr:MAG: glycosyltransferase [Actinomycetota bacterium]
MLPTVPVPPQHVDDYAEAAGPEAVDRLRQAAESLRGARVLHVNSTAFGGGVAELLFTQVALMNDLGIDTTWQVIEGAEDFFTVTKFAHNGLQGAQVPWTPDMEAIYLDRCRSNAAGLAEGYDYVVIHDPQPAGVLGVLEEEGRRAGRWIWRCHIDLSAPHRPVLDFFTRRVAGYDGMVFTMREFAPPGLTGPRLFVIPPSIDPLSLKNGFVDHETAYEVLNRYGVDRARPILTQVSRFDPWKDPLGVIDAYRLARREHPGLQLLLVGSMAHDDPEGWHYLEVTETYREGDPDIYLLSNLQEVGHLEVNAFQRASTVVVQKSLREGFGLVVSEAMWKEVPVIGGDVGGIRLQIEDGVSGFLVSSVEECAERASELLSDPDLRMKMGRAGRERVRERFLTLRELEDYVRMLAAL